MWVCTVVIRFENGEVGSVGFGTTNDEAFADALRVGDIIRDGIFEAIDEIPESLYAAYNSENFVTLQKELAVVGGDLYAFYKDI